MQLTIESTDMSAVNPSEIVAQLENYKFDDAIRVYIGLDDNSLEEVVCFIRRRMTLNSVVEHQVGRDKIGRSGKAATVAISALGGGSAAVATGLGGTILGSSALGSALGGFLAVTTPIGWILGGAAVAAAVGYGVTKLVSDGAGNDKIREQNIRNAKSPEIYNALRTVSPLLFEMRDEILEIINSYRKIKVISPEKGGRYSGLDVEEMLNLTTKLKIDDARKSVGTDLESVSREYLASNQAKLSAMSNFLEKAKKHEFLSADKTAEIVKGVNNCDILIEDFTDYVEQLKKEIILRMQVMLYKQAILADEVATEGEIGWYTTRLGLLGVDKEKSIKLFEECPSEARQFSEIISALSDLFEQDLSVSLVDDVATILAVDGLSKSEYVFLKAVCAAAGRDSHFVLQEYEKTLGHKFDLIMSKVKSLFGL